MTIFFIAVFSHLTVPLTEYLKVQYFGNIFFSLTKVKVKVDIKFYKYIKFNIYLKSKISK